MSNRSRRRSRGKSSRQWRRMDLHLHTPGSADYQQPEVSYLDIMRQAELRGLDILAFTDHNTVAGYKAMLQEIADLRLLGQLGRLAADEQRFLDEYERLLKKILVLPGFEFTAMFGFHVLAIFAPETRPGYLEHILLTLGVAPERLDTGSTTVGATDDVLTAYRVIDEAGGLVIAAHANSSNGVAMRGLDFGGQTRIAYTQDPHLHALEVTDLDKRGRHTSRYFFDGSKPEYPRAMHLIQGSDAHRLVRDPGQPRYLGVGERITEVLLEEVSFTALAAVIKGTDLSLTRPFRGKAPAFDFVQAAQEQGESLVQAFHPSMQQRGGHLNRILADIGAMANTNGGTIYIGVTANPREEPPGVRNIDGAVARLQDAISKHLNPEPIVSIDSVTTRGQPVVRVVVAPGTDLPYAIDQNRFYIRDEAESNLAVRDEIVQLFERRIRLQQEQDEVNYETLYRKPAGVTLPLPASQAAATGQPSADQAGAARQATTAPRTGVEVVSSETRQGTTYHTLRDLRNGNLIKNVTRSSARKLWHYAISQVEAGQPDKRKIKWQGNKALLNVRRKDNHAWYDLAMKENGQTHVYFGVTDSGLNDDWLRFIEQTSPD